MGRQITNLIMLFLKKFIDFQISYQTQAHTPHSGSLTIKLVFFLFDQIKNNHNFIYSILIL